MLSALFLTISFVVWRLHSCSMLLPFVRMCARVNVFVSMCVSVRERFCLRRIAQSGVSEAYFGRCEGIMPLNSGAPPGWLLIVSFNCSVRFRLPFWDSSILSRRCIILSSVPLPFSTCKHWKIRSYRDAFSVLSILVFNNQPSWSYDSNRDKASITFSSVAVRSNFPRSTATCTPHESLQLTVAWSGYWSSEPPQGSNITAWTAAVAWTIAWCAMCIYTRANTLLFSSLVLFNIYSFVSMDALFTL